MYLHCTRLINVNREQVWLHAIKFNWLLPFFVLFSSFHSCSALQHVCYSLDRHTHAHKSCSETLHINSGGDGNISFVKQVSMESWIMCLLCKMEKFVDVAAIIIVCVSSASHCPRSRTQHVFPFLNSVASLFFVFDFFASPLVLPLFYLILFYSLQRQERQRRLQWVGWWPLQPIEICFAWPCAM